MTVLFFAPLLCIRLCAPVCPQAFVFDTVPAPNTKKGMQAAALIAARKRKLADAAGGGAGADVAPAAADGEQGPAKRPKLEGTV